MNGLFLQGGGAKGAFQAGVIHGLKEQGIDFHVISGTSIGAMNAYCLYAGQVKQLKEMWLGSETEVDTETKYFDKVFENDKIIRRLSTLQGENEKVQAIYVNYVEIDHSMPREVVVNLMTLKKEQRLEAVKYSSLLPLRMDREMTMSEIMKTYDSNRIFGEFQEDLAKGVYDGCRLDGGILNNNLLAPFVRERVDRLFMIPFHKEYQIPEYITEIYDEGKLTVITPKTELLQSDVLRFEKEFCEKIYAEGYEIGRLIQL